MLLLENLLEVPDKSNANFGYQPSTDSHANSVLILVHVKVYPGA